MSYVLESVKGQVSTYTKGRFDSHLRNSNTTATAQSVKKSNGFVHQRSAPTLVREIHWSAKAYMPGSINETRQRNDA